MDSQPTQNQENIIPKQSDNLDAISDLSKNILEGIDRSFLETFLLDNKIEFKHNDKEYRIRKLNFNEKQIAYKKRTEKFHELLKDENIMMKKALIKKLKEKGLDIEEIQNKIQVLQKKKQEVQYKIGETLEKKLAENILEDLKNEYINIEKEQNILLAEESSYLEFSLENQLLAFIYTYYTWLVTEVKQEDGSYKKAWETFEDFSKEQDEGLVKTSVYYTALISREDIEL